MLNEYEYIEYIVLEWQDVDISINKWYQNRHWSFRHKEKQFWANLFIRMLPKRARQADKYTIYMRYNSRLDPTNVTAMVKLAEDTLKKNYYLTDDTKKYCKGIVIEPDDTMNKKHYILTFNIISYAKADKSK